MAQCHRPKTHAVFYELVPVHVPHMAAFASHDKPGRKDGVLVVSFGIGVAAARYQRMAFFLQLF